MEHPGITPHMVEKIRHIARMHGQTADADGDYIFKYLSRLSKEVETWAVSMQEWFEWKENQREDS